MSSLSSMGSVTQDGGPCFTKYPGDILPQTHRGAERGIRGAKFFYWCLLAQVSSRGKDAPYSCLQSQGRKEEPWEAERGLQSLCAISEVNV